MKSVRTRYLLEYLIGDTNVRAHAVHYKTQCNRIRPSRKQLHCFRLVTIFAVSYVCKYIYVREGFQVYQH
jgi:hypothetical protein